MLLTGVVLRITVASFTCAIKQLEALASIPFIPNLSTTYNHTIIMSNRSNKLILIGNGFDLAHGLKTSYKDFLNWYICYAFNECLEKNVYKDALIEFHYKFPGMMIKIDQKPTTLEEVFSFITPEHYTTNYPSNLFKRLLEEYQNNNWVDIERFYFNLLKAFFLNPNMREKKEIIFKLNTDFNFMITKLSEYIKIINKTLIDPQSSSLIILA